MDSVTRETPPDFITWAFGPAFRARLDAIDAERAAEPRPTADPGYAPSAFEDAFWAGYTLGLDREDAAPPAEFTRSQSRAFRGGWAAGSREWERRLDEMFAERAADGRVTDQDLYRAGGVS